MKFQNENPEVLKSQALAQQPKAQAALEKLKKLPPDVLGKELTEKMTSCAAALSSASDNALSTGDPKAKALLSSCSEDEIRSLINQVKQKRDEAIQNWDTCRAKIVNAPDPKDPKKTVDASAIPLNPSGLAPDSQQKAESNLDSLIQSFPPKSELGACATALKTSLAQVKASDDTLSDWQQILSMAATVCAMSGGNPYVCAVLAGFALLVEIIHLITGGKGIGEAAAGPAGPGKMPGKETDGKPGGVPGGFGVSASGPITCTRGGKAITCSEDGYSPITIDPTPGPSHFIDNPPDESERAMIEKAIVDGDAKRFYFCQRPAGNKSFIFGFLFFDNSKYYPVSVNLIGSDVKLGFQAANDRGGAKESDLCTAAFNK
jgi:hypothetical protein